MSNNPNIGRYLQKIPFDILGLPDHDNPNNDQDYLIIFDSLEGITRKVHPSALFSGGFATSGATITKVAHGFVTGNWLTVSGSGFILANANSPTTADLVGVVASVIDADNFILVSAGRVTLTGASFTPNTKYFLSNTVAGSITSTEPTTSGHVSKPAFISDSLDSGFIVNMRGKIIA